MRRASLAALVALVVSAGVLSGTASGNTQRLRHYKGTTLEGAIVRIEVWVSSHGVVHLASLLVSHAPYSCEDGTDGKTGTGVGWVPGRYGPVIEDQRLELSLDSGAFTVSGRLGVHRGSGTLAVVMAGLTADEQAAMVCTIPEVAWTVERTTGVGIPFRGSTAVKRLADGRIVMTGERASVFRPATAVAPTKAPVRHYRGRLEGGRGMNVFTQRVNTGIRVVHFDFGYDLACDDGSTLEGRWVRFWTPSQALPPGRFDFDFATVVQPSLALHVHGEIDPHLGAGTFTYVQAELTDDLQAKLCTSSEVTWKLWRTDAGY